ncbi:hypothetical protein C2845_PM09G23130 [Panicum miliaceum]|uniref:rRNA 2'-O-methyltransferase fibrillarin-like n=1 Tax=Panicum miliaceum TaxID=4540 RepID=A0A3L6RZW1_PANMI|nr:hypothetical protein C2845_PM09G23130 [Panicum miliaceum]
MRPPLRGKLATETMVSKGRRGGRVGGRGDGGGNGRHRGGRRGGGRNGPGRADTRGRRPGGRTPVGGRGGGMKGGSKVVVQPHKHSGVFITRAKEDALCTRNMCPGESVYGEKRVSVQVLADASSLILPLFLKEFVVQCGWKLRWF